MLKRELKINLKSFLIWTTVLVSLFLIAFLMYPSIMKSENVQMIDEMIKIFPEEVLKALNMDISSIDTAFGWLKSEGFIFVLLIIGAYASILGSNILLKEESDKTIEYLNSLPIKRSTILTQKIICAIIYIVLIVITTGIFNYIGLSISGKFDQKQYLLLSITPLLSALPLFAITLFISTFFHKTKHTFGIGLGLTLISYFLQVLSEISETTEFLKLFTVYTLSDVRNVIIHTSIDPITIIISLSITSLFLIGTYLKYNQKELV